MTVARRFIAGSGIYQALDGRGKEIVFRSSDQGRKKSLPTESYYTITVLYQFWYAARQN
jgi:hypothetical protein